MKQQLYKRVIAFIVIAVAITLVLIPGVEDEGIVYGYGGGGGGGGGASMKGNFEMCVCGDCDTDWYINYWGTLLDDVSVTSPGGDVTISVDKYTKMYDQGGDRILGMGVAPVDDPPSPPSGYSVLKAFDFDPNGATFDPGVEITIVFDPGDVAEGDTVVIAYYDEDAGEWQFIEGTVNEDGTATFTVTHFTIFGVLSTAAPAPTPTATPTQTATPTPAAGGGLGGGAWAGIGIAIIVVVVAVLLLIVGMQKRRRGSGV